MTMTWLDRAQQPTARSSANLAKESAETRPEGNKKWKVSQSEQSFRSGWGTCPKVPQQSKSRVRLTMTDDTFDSRSANLAKESSDTQSSVGEETDSSSWSGS